MSNDNIDDTWDRASFASESAWQEMNKFLQSINGPPSSEEDGDRRNAQFLAILDRCNKRAIEIFERAKGGDPAPHLKVIK